MIEASASGLLNEQKETSRTCEMSLQAKALAARVNSLNSVCPESTWWKQRTAWQKLSSDHPRARAPSHSKWDVPQGDTPWTQLATLCCPVTLSHLLSNYSFSSCMYVVVLPAWLCATSVQCLQRSEEGSRCLEQDLQIVMGCYVGAWNRTRSSGKAACVLNSSSHLTFFPECQWT